MALPADTFACTWFFNQGQSGWSETLYAAAGNHDQAKAKAAAYAKLRKEMLAQGNYLTHFRVSKVSIPGDSLPVYLVGKDQVQTGAGLEGDVPWNCLLLRMDAVDRTSHRNHYMRGIEDVDLSNYGIKGFRFTDRQMSNRFQNWVGNGQNPAVGSLRTWSFIGVDKQAQSIPITDCISLYAGAVLEYTAAGHTNLVGDKVRIAGVGGMRSANGLKYVTKVDGDKFQVRLPLAVMPIGLYSGGGMVRKQSKVLHQIDQVQIVRASHRQTGRPSGAPVGRRKRAI